ncbi:hypothetical protein ACFV9E_03610 [Streptomyces sp. NPDC059835]|uniref:hypothetical protein n=1 Tax=Streptomyces sp. NPDC059835 TaxID=3346967 RepID=UPI0036663861
MTLDESDAEPSLGHGVSYYDGGRLLHLAASSWQYGSWPGAPRSPFPELRLPCPITTAQARCGRRLTWQSGTPLSDETGPRCSTCFAADRP